MREEGVTVYLAALPVHARGLVDDILETKSSCDEVKYAKVALILNLFNFLKPTGHVTHHQFNIQQLYPLPTLYLCVLYLSENKQRLVPLTA